MQFFSNGSTFAFGDVLGRRKGNKDRKCVKSINDSSSWTGSVIGRSNK